MSKSRNWIAPLAVLAVATAVAVAGCGSDTSGGSQKIAATTGILADITEQVAGPDAEVVQIIPDASSPHDFQLSAKDRQTIEESLLLVHNGAGLEQGIPTADFDVDQFALADHVGTLRPFAAVDEGEESGGDDPHVWMDPTKVAQALPALAGALADADPDHAKGYRRRAQAYAASLGALDGQIKQTLAVVPPADRKLVTSHDALGYFADRYGFEVAATPFPASGPEAEASASTVSHVEDVIRETGVPTVFAQADDDPKLLDQIASDTGVEVIDDLHIEAPVGDEHYDAMLQRDAELIASGLGAP
jgi:zinc/manganese transport system substrate-binding protein